MRNNKTFLFDTRNFDPSILFVSLYEWVASSLSLSAALRLALLGQDIGPDPLASPGGGPAGEAIARHTCLEHSTLLRLNFYGASCIFAAELYDRNEVPLHVLLCFVYLLHFLSICLFSVYYEETYLFSYCIIIVNNQLGKIYKYVWKIAFLCILVAFINRYIFWYNN